MDQVDGGGYSEMVCIPCFQNDHVVNTDRISNWIHMVFF